MKRYYDIVNVVWLYEEKAYGTVEKMGAFASLVKYKKDGIEYEELMRMMSLLLSKKLFSTT